MKEKKNPLIDYRMLGLTIHRLRKERGFSQAEMAKMVSCSVTHYSRVESGYRPSLDLLTKISRSLTVSMDELLGVPAQVNPHLKDLENLLASRPLHEQEFIAAEVFHMMDFFKDMTEKHLYRPFAEPFIPQEEDEDPSPMEVAEGTDEYGAR